SHVGDGGDCRQEPDDSGVTEIEPHINPTGFCGWHGNLEIERSPSTGDFVALLQRIGWRLVIEACICRSSRVGSVGCAAAALWRHYIWLSGLSQLCLLRSAVVSRDRKR